MKELIFILACLSFCCSFFNCNRNIVDDVTQSTLSQDTIEREVPDTSDFKYIDPCMITDSLFFLENYIGVGIQSYSEVETIAFRFDCFDGEIPNFILKCNNLRNLAIMGWEKFDSSKNFELISKLKKLESLYFERVNSLIHIPNVISLNNSIRFIRLADCKNLKSISCEVSNMKNLKPIYIEGLSSFKVTDCLKGFVIQSQF